MTIDELKSLVAADEHKELELKKSTAELKDGMRSACAFLNTNGGWLIFGVTPTSLKIVGQQVNDSTQRDISQAISGLEPAVSLQVEYIDVPEHPKNKVIAIHFDGWALGKEPYTYNGCPYYRVESTTRQMPRKMFDERLKASNPQFFGWENQIAVGYSINDIDEARLRSAVRSGAENGRISSAAINESVEALLGHLNLMKDGKLLNAAVMLFGNNTRDYPQLLIRLAFFAGTEKGDFIDNKRYHGNFFELLDAGMEFAYRHLSISGRVVGWKRQDKLEIPIVALREALVNSLCHRIYDNPGTSVGLAIYEDRVEIENPGHFPDGLTVDNIKEPHKSQPYNHLIAEVLYKTMWLESWGTGVKKMIEACKADNVPEPYYEVCGGFVTVVFKKSISQLKNGESDGESDGESNSKIQLSDRQRLILSAIVANVSETAAHLARVTGISQRSVERDINFLRNHGFIDKTTKDTRSPWVVLKKD